MRRTYVFVVLMALIVLPACGGGTGSLIPGLPSNFRVGSPVYGMPFLPTAVGDVQALGLKNLANIAAPVQVTAYLPDGTEYGPGTQDILLPASGENRFPITNFTGIGFNLGGWLSIDTRNLNDLDPVTGVPTLYPTSGLVLPVLYRASSTREEDGHSGLVGRFTHADIVINSQTRSVQLINASYLEDPGGVTPQDLDFDVTVFDAFGDVFDFNVVAVPGNGAVQVNTGVLELGSVHVTPTLVPADVVPVFNLATLEDDPQVLVTVETRLVELTDNFRQQVGIGFDLEFGEDNGGNIHDFGVYFSNPSNETLTAQLRNIYRADGTSILTQPQLVTLGPKTSKYMATTTLDSRGLDVGETSIFEDVFGNVDVFPGFEVFYVDLQIPKILDVTARDFDSRFKSYRRILPGYRQSTDVVVPNMNYATTTAGGTRNYVTLMNPNPSDINVNIRGFTPGGTEYILDPVLVPALSRRDWSPDGNVFREDPTDIQLPPVPYLSFLFSSNGGIYANGRRRRVDSNELLVFVTPYIVQDLRDD